MRRDDKRTGTVTMINTRRAMVAVATEDDGYTIIELLDEDLDIEVGDVLVWQNGYGLGSEVYLNVTKGTRGDVFVQNHCVSAAILPQQLLL